MLLPTALVDRLGIQHQTELVVRTEKGDVPVVVCVLAKDGTLREIFSRIAPLEELTLPTEVVDGFKAQHYGQLQDEDHATLFCCDGGIIVNIEHDDVRGGYDKNEFVLDFVGRWCAKHHHQVVIPAGAFQKFVWPGNPS